jgi:hypothetical protein
MPDMQGGATSAAYQDYLRRFSETLGDIQVGAFVKHNGQLIQKMTAKEFEEQRKNYETLLTTYERAMVRGDTINEAVVRILREGAARLMQKAPATL